MDSLMNFTRAGLGFFSSLNIFFKNRIASFPYNVGVGNIGLAIQDIEKMRFIYFSPIIEEMKCYQYFEEIILCSFFPNDQ